MKGHLQSSSPWDCDVCCCAPCKDCISGAGLWEIAQAGQNVATANLRFRNKEMRQRVVESATAAANTIVIQVRNNQVKMSTA